MTELQLYPLPADPLSPSLPTALGGRHSASQLGIRKGSVPRASRDPRRARFSAGPRLVSRRPAR
jgi:hypothetical protein